MSVAVTGSKTVTKDVAPHLNATLLTMLPATPVEALTVKQLQQPADATKRLPHGEEPATVLGTLFV